MQTFFPHSNALRTLFLVLRSSPISFQFNVSQSAPGLYRYEYSQILDYFTEGKVYLRRDVSIIDEDGESYYIDICIDDPEHPLQPDVCGRLNVTFISKLVCIYVRDFTSYSIMTEKCC